MPDWSQLTLMVTALCAGSAAIITALRSGHSKKVLDKIHADTNANFTRAAKRNRMLAKIIKGLERQIADLKSQLAVKVDPPERKP